MKLFIDVREPAEFETNHLKGALNIPLSTLINNSAKLDLLPQSAELIVYCNSGRRSATALPMFKAAGFKDVLNGVNIQQIQEKSII